jgi:hypothetical protein
MGENFQEMVLKMNAQLQSISSIEENQRSILLQQDDITMASKQLLQETKLIQDDATKACQTAQKESRVTRNRIDESSQRIIEVVCSKIDELRTAGKTAMSGGQSIREIRFFGESQDNLLGPLLLLKDWFTSAVLHILSHHVEGLSQRRLLASIRV